MGTLRSLLILLMLGALPGCSSIPLSTNPARFSSGVRRQIQVGMPASEAEILLKRNGFKCTDRFYERFNASKFDSSRDSERLGVVTNLTMRVCVKTRTQVFPLQRNDYTVGLVLDEDEKVKSIFA
jgi:hypothetical protein